MIFIPGMYSETGYNHISLAALRHSISNELTITIPIAIAVSYLSSVVTQKEIADQNSRSSPQTPLS